MSHHKDRAVSPIISTILMVAVTVILASVIAVFVLGLGEDVENPGPNIADSSGTLTVQDGYTGGVIRITHLAGDPVDVEELEVTVDATAACDERARILNLPSDAVNIGFKGFANENLREGDDSIISKGSFNEEWDIGVLHADNDNTFEAGSFFEFRIAKGDCLLDAGDEITVRVVHEPTNAVVITEKLQVP